MFLLLWVTVALSSLYSLPPVYGQDPEIEMTVPEIIRRWGYPVEVHYAVTRDGYILEMHRIPHGKTGAAPNIKRPVMFLQHGLESSSSNWVMNLPKQSAGFIFADAGFDVWMGNMRGNKFSKSHAFLDPMSSDFWNFTWDSMAQYDLPAMIDQVLLVSGQEYVYYVGHSQGTLTMFAKLSMDTAFSKKIKMFFALAPILTAAHVKGLLKTLVAEAPPELTTWTELFGSQEFLTSNFLTYYLISNGCRYAFQREICKQLLFAIGGPGLNTNTLPFISDRFTAVIQQCLRRADLANDVFLINIPKDNIKHQLVRNRLYDRICIMENCVICPYGKSRIPVYFSHFPAGTSSLNMLHWVQMVRTGATARLDRGAETNMATYGQETPPTYNFRDIPRIPIYLFSGGNDWIAVDEDTYGSLIPQIGPIIQQHTHLPEYNHFDFVFGLRASVDVYTPIMDLIQKSLQ